MVGGCWEGASCERSVCPWAGGVVLGGKLCGEGWAGMLEQLWVAEGESSRRR